MKTKLILVLMIAGMCTAFSEPLKVADTGVTFEPPAEFKKVPQQIVDLKWPNKNAPRFVVGNESASTTIAYDLKNNRVPEAQLPLVKEEFTKPFNRVIPGIRWKKSEIIEHSGQKWLYLEMTSNAVDTDIHNIMLVTGYQGKMLIFNFNSTRGDFKRYEAQLRASIKSIKLP